MPRRVETIQTLRERWGEWCRVAFLNAKDWPNGIDGVQKRFFDKNGRGKWLAVVSIPIGEVGVNELVVEVRQSDSIGTIGKRLWIIEGRE